MKISLPERSINCKGDEDVAYALQTAIREVERLTIQKRVLSNHYDPDTKKVVEADDITWLRAGDAPPELLAQMKSTFSKMPPVLDEVTAKIWTIRLKKFRDASLPVEDNRKTEAALIAEYNDEEERERESVRAQEEQAKENALYNEEQRKLREGKVEIKDNQTGFIISEDYKTDERGRITDRPKLVKLVKRDRQGETALRNAAALCPELNELELVGDGGGTRSWMASVETKGTHDFTDNGGRVRASRYRVDLAHGGWYEPHPSFVDETLVPEPAAKSGGRATVRRNHALDGIEIKFPSRPPELVLIQLRNSGFRWHSLKKHWYAKYTTERETLLAKLAA